MLTLSGVRNGRLCNGVSRRRFMQIGSLSLFGLTLPDLLRAEARRPRPIKTIDHSDLATRRTISARYVRYETECGRGGARPLSANLNQLAWSCRFAS